MAKTHQHMPTPPGQLKISNKLQYAPGAQALLAPTVVEARDPPILYPGAVAESGVTVRIVATESIRAGNSIRLTWRGKANYRTTLPVTEAGRYIDFVLPKNLVLDNIVEGEAPVCDIFYEVEDPVSGNVEFSPTLQIYIVDALGSLDPVTVPQAPNGEFNPHDIPEPGLRINFPQGPLIIGAGWTSYARDGHVIATVRFGIADGEDFVYMWRFMLDQTEPGGEVQINYTGSNERYIIESLYTALRIIG
ncbi:hypothetical protein ACCD10_04785 [Pseudomonas sp. Pseusp122]|uniref:hypothetical protein n=1 Tax=unclassified Pseudomonas TaxID=196821 RepID=UPI0039A4B982